MLAIYVTGLVLERMRAQGGVQHYEALNRRKAKKVYAAIDEGQEKGVFKKKVKTGSESWMNAVFEVLGEGAEKRFLDGAKEALIEETDWSYEEEFGLLKDELKSVADQCRKDETKKMVNTIEVRATSIKR